MWDVAEEKEVLALRGVRYPIFALAVSRDGKTIALGGPFGKPGEVCVWDASTGELRLYLREPQGTVYTVSVNADGSEVLTGAYRGPLRVWEVPRAK